MNQSNKIVSTFLALIICSCISAQKGGKLKLWYEKPATLWNEALPVGNGRIAAMIFGTPSQENLQLNESSVWAGGPSRNDNTKALAALPTVRSYIFAGKYTEAQTLADSDIKASVLQGAPYQTVGNLQMSFPNQNSYTDYYRELDIENAVQTTTYSIGDINYKHEIFASKPDQVIVVRLTASKPGSLTFSAAISSALQKTIKNTGNNILELTGLSGAYGNVTGKVKFTTQVKVINIGGTISGASNKINVSNADTVTIYVSMATNFVNYNDLTANDALLCTNYINQVSSKTYNNIKNDHIEAYQAYFKRVNLDLGSTVAADNPTDIRIRNFSRTYDPELVSLFFQFGRYLLISSSQPGGQPANLQGIWNNQTSPMWGSKYTININTEMNYWPAEATNLPEMHEPLIQMIQELSEAGKQTAQTMYGARGWVAHHNTDIWRSCGVVDGAQYGMWPMGGAWLSQHLWEKYMYNGDKNYLQTVYPILKSACEFYLDFLVEEPTTKWMVVCPSMSPENGPSTHSSPLSAGTTMDNQLLFDLFNKTIKTANILKTDSTFVVSLKAMLLRLAPMQIGKYGQLQEWLEDLDSKDDHNRHVSHLYGAFPGNQISAYKTPKLLDAVRSSLMYRGDASTGWSMAWKVNLWARMHDGNHAYKLITDQLTIVDPSITSVSGGGGTYPNMFDAHPPFQIDGNFGCTSGITEMIMQSHDEAIDFLPALPDLWQSGSISGLKTRGGFETEIVWENHKIKRLMIKSNLGGNCRIRVPNTVALENNGILKNAQGNNPNPFFDNPTIAEPIISSQAKLNDLKLSPTYLYDFQTEAGQTYTIIGINAPQFQNAKVEENPQIIQVQFTEPLKVQNSYNGFVITKNGVTTVSTDSIKYDSISSVLNIYFASKFTKDNQIKIAYNGNSVISKFGFQLSLFSDTIVYNLLKGSSPVVVASNVAIGGDSVYVKFSKKIFQPAVPITNFSIVNQSASGKQITTSTVAIIPTDSQTLILIPSEHLYGEYKLSLSYSGSEIVAKDGGILKAISGYPINNHSNGFAPTIQSSTIDNQGHVISLHLNKTISYIVDQISYFSLTLNGKAISITDVYKKDSDILIESGKTIRAGDIVKVSYAGGDINAIDGGKLVDFADLLILNPLPQPEWITIPGKIESEKYTNQFGTQTETCGDTGGGIDVDYIDTNDWLEYAINIATDTIYKATFRLASPYSGGAISVLLDDIKVGNLSFTGTGAWQTYKSFSTDIPLKSGKHYLKLLITVGGFNINWFQFEIKNTTAIDELHESGISIYPNPVKRELVVKCDKYNFNKTEIQDISGKTIFSQDFNSTNKKVITVNLSKGVYVLIVSSDNKKIKSKFIVG